MKKLFSYITLATLLFATSCSEKEEFAGEGDGTVTFSLQLPDGVATRAIGDGTTAKDLTYAVYEAGETEPLIVGAKGSVKFDDNLTATVSLRLVTGKTYDFIFFADAAEGSPYTFNQNDQTVTISYDKVVSNDEQRDAFFAAREGLKVEGQVTEKITLRRPFAQLNVGTNDLADAVKAGLVEKDMTTQMVAPSYSAWNLKSGEVVGEAQDVTFAFATRPNNPSTFTLKDDNSKFAYDYLSMNYLLAKSDKELINCKFTVKEGEKVLNELALTSVPVQRNFRTNIVGSILTSQADFTIIIDPIFTGDINHEWDGTNSLDLNNTTTVLKDIDTTAPLTISGTGTLVLDNVTICPATEGASALTLADGTNATIEIRGNVRLAGARGGNGIEIPETASLELTGETLTAIGNNGAEYYEKEGYGTTTDTFFKNLSGSGIGNSNTALAGNIKIHDLQSLTAEGYGSHGFGIGGNTASIEISNTTIEYARGGFAEKAIQYGNYGKNEPEGGCAIGTEKDGGKVVLDNVTVKKAEGGSKSAAIGGSFHISVEVEITNSNLSQIIGGNGAAAIGSSRYSGNDTENLKITIDNSTISAQGGQHGAGIGSGYDCYCKTKHPKACEIYITGNSTIAAVGGEYAAGIGTGYHVGGLSGSIDASVDVTGTTAGPGSYKPEQYTKAQAIGYGIVDPNREFKDAQVTFTVGGTVIAAPVVGE